MKSPSANAYFTERENGTIIFSNDGTEVELVPSDSSCGSEDSIFSIFSQSGEKLEIFRDGDSLILNLPANYLDDYLNSITAPQITSIRDFIIVGYTLLYYGKVALFGSFLDMLSPEFLKTVVVGNLRYDKNTLSNFQERYDNRIEGCFSLESITRFIQN